ncbi:MAG: ATP-dependent Clp protease ATP-binding subunit [Bacilli bacterium]|nr:ATP-dependent Clp protease ATP-binding subunit [Bacilli bacterium]
MFSNFNEETRKILVNAKIEMKKLKHPYVGSEHLLLAILKENNNISKRLNQFNLNYNKLRQEIINIIGIGSEESNWTLYTPVLKRIIENAILESKENNNNVTTEHLFAGMLEEGEGVAIRIMIGLNIDLDLLYNEFVCKIVNKKNKKNKKLVLEELGIDLTEQALENRLDPVIGRNNEVKRVLEILARRNKNNPLLIGDAGVGKTAIVEELSRLISLKQVPLLLQNKRIISLDMASSVAGTKYRGEFEERIKKILKEVEENDDIILFIDEIHTLVGAGGAEGAIDASNIFKPALARGKLRCIGATTTLEYKKYIEKDSALERRFQCIMIEEPDFDTVKDILNKLKPIYEKYHFVKISDEILNTIVELSNKYIYNRHEPDKSIDILDEVCASVSLKENKNLKKYNDLQKELDIIIKNKNEYLLKNKFDKALIYKEEENKILNKINNLENILNKKITKNVTKKDVANIISNKSKIPLYEILNDNKKMIKKIENDIKNKILGQENAVNETLKLIKKIKLGYKDNKCYSLLFVGPSGVGKTALAKIIGDNLVSKNNVIKLDMSEYAMDNSVNKIIGAPPGYVGYDDFKNILQEIKNKPYSVLILDEIEKAHSNVINLFFQIMEDNQIKDNNSNIIRFDNVIIIMTSNVGYDEINLGFCKDENTKLISKLKNHFSIPFINRIDNIVNFNLLKEHDILNLINIKIDNITKKYKDIKITISDNVKKEILKKSNYEQFGARKLDKIIKNEIENIIIDNLIENKTEIKIDDIKQHTLT